MEFSNTTVGAATRQVCCAKTPLATNTLNNNPVGLTTQQQLEQEMSNHFFSDYVYFTDVRVCFGDRFITTTLVRDLTTIYGIVNSADEELMSTDDSTTSTSSTSERGRSLSTVRTRAGPQTLVRCLNIREVDDHFDEAMEIHASFVDLANESISVSESSDSTSESKVRMPNPGAPTEDWDYFFTHCTAEQFEDAPLTEFFAWEDRDFDLLDEDIETESCPQLIDCAELDPIDEEDDESSCPSLQDRSAFPVDDSDDESENMEPHSGLEYMLNPDFADDEPALRNKIERKLDFTVELREQLSSVPREVLLEQSRLFDKKFEIVRAEWEATRGKMTPQGGQEDSMNYWLDKLDTLRDRIASYSEVLSTREVRRVVKHVEKLIFLFIQLRETRSYLGVTACIMGYIGIFFEDSLFDTLRDYLSDCLAMEAHVGDEDDSEDDGPAWLSIFRSVTKEWKSVSHMPAWKYLQRVLSLCVATGLCHAADVNPQIGDMKLFTIKIAEKQASAADLMDAILVTADYFVEAGYEAFKTRSIRPFYFDNQTARILDEAYIGISASMKALPTGDLENTKYKSEAQLAHVLENTLSGYVILRMQTKNSSEKRTLDSRCMQLEEWKLQFIQQTVAGGVREAPYSVYLVGEPGIGKTMMTQVLVEVVLQANGITYTMKQIATVNPGDKFASTVKNDTLVIILDDFGNFVLEFENENPLKYIIEICNNVVSYVPKAEANEKGKIAWRPKMVVTTSNLDDLLFNKLSNKPGSAKRRGIRMKPTLRAEYAEHGRFSEDKYRAKHGNLPAIADAYDIDIQEWGIKQWEFFTFRGNETRSLSYADALEFHIEKSREHFAKQKSYVNNHGKIREQIIVCEHGRVQATCAKCKAVQADDELMSEDSFSDEKFEKACAAALEMVPHFGVETFMVWFWRWLVGRFFNMLSPLTMSFGDWARTCPSKTLRDVNEKLHYMSLFGLYDWLPDCIVQHPMFERYLLFMNARALIMRYWQLFAAFCCSFSLFLLGPATGGACILFIWPYLLQCGTKTHVAVIEEFAERRGALPLEFTKSRDDFLKYALAGVFMLTGLATAYRLYSSTKAMEPQGNLTPTSMAEIKKRDAETNVWSRIEVEPLPASDKSKCLSFDELTGKVIRNLVYINYVDEEDGITKFTNGFFVSSNELLIPYHVLTTKPRQYKIYRRGENVRGGQFSEIISLGAATVHPEKDLALVQCCNTSPFADLTPYLTIENHPSAPFTLLHKMKDDTVKVGHGHANYEKISNGIRKNMGYYYELEDMTTFPGMCMAPILAQTRAPQIIGFHIGGHTGTSKGCATALTLKEYQELHDLYYDQHVSALQVNSEGELFTEHYGIEYYEGPEIHVKSPLNWLPEECNIRYFGSCKGRATYYSDVVPTPIAQLITDVCGHEQEYAGPHFHRWKSWYESLVYSCDPAIGCETEYLDWAVADYSAQIQQILKVEGLIEETCKLSEIEIVSGKDGVRFVTPMAPNTSCGYPLGGPKRGKMIDLPPNKYHNCPRTFCTGVWEEHRRFIAAIRTGQRYYPLFKACLKDEPTKIEKEKVRVFQAAPLQLQIAIREYFLPLARLLSLFPLISECAVGINAVGPEWDQLQAHIKKFGTERIVAGDYSKYDLRMSAKLTSAAFKILIDFAEACGYSQDDLAIMRGIATEVIYPMMAFNGDLIMLQGSNPSGQNLTVYINSIVNSLLNRIGFFKLNPDFKGRFCDAVALATYGDDFKSSASEKFPNFNHITLAEVLSTIDMKITMPDKTSEPVPFLTDAQCDFLKRTNVYHEVGYYLGALSEDSIFKSLKAVLRSKHMSLKEQAAINIDGALREWFIHGREIFEKRQEQMKKVAAEAGITHMCATLDVSFDERLQMWREQYTPGDLDLPDDVEAEPEEVDEMEPHSGVECVEYTEVSIPGLAEIAHYCVDGVEYLWFTPIPGPLKQPTLLVIFCQWLASWILHPVDTVCFFLYWYWLYCIYKESVPMLRAMRAERIRHLEVLEQVQYDLSYILLRNAPQICRGGIKGPSLRSDFSEEFHN
jgi:hypothetical protein